MKATHTAPGTDVNRTTAWIRRLTCAVALTVGLAVTGAGAQESNPGNFFDRHPGLAGGRTSVDPFDPYAPVGFDEPTAITARKSGIPSAAPAATRSESTLPPMPGLPGEPF